METGLWLILLQFGRRFGLEHAFELVGKLLVGNAKHLHLVVGHDASEFDLIEDFHRNPMVEEFCLQGLEVEVVEVAWVVGQKLF